MTSVSYIVSTVLLPKFISIIEQDNSTVLDQIDNLFLFYENTTHTIYFIRKTILATTKANPSKKSCATRSFSLSWISSLW